MAAEGSRQRDGFVGQVLESSLQPGVRYTIERRLAEGGTRRRGPQETRE